MGVSKRKPDPQSSNSFKCNGKKPRQYDDQEYVSRYQSFTPLNQSLSNKLILVKPIDILTTLPRIKGLPNKRDMSEYCHYHCKNGHDTNNCQALKDEIEQLIRCRQLGEFDLDQNARQNQPQHQAPVHQDEAVQEQEFEVKMIIGGPSTGDNNQAQKNYVLG